MLGKRPRSYIAGLIFAATASACGGVASIRLYDQPIDANLSFRLIDARPEGRQYPWLVVDKLLYFYGDDDTTPPKMQLLGYLIEGRLGRQLAGKTIQINRFEIANFYGKQENQRYLIPLYEDVDRLSGEISGSVDGIPFEAKRQMVYDAGPDSPLSVHASPQAQEVMRRVVIGVIQQAIDEIGKIIAADQPARSPAVLPPADPPR